MALDVGGGVELGENVLGEDLSVERTTKNQIECFVMS